MATRMQQRRGTAAQWISTNSGNGPILNAGEIGFETDTNKFKIGDGTNHWINLDYFIDANSTVNPAFGSSITFEGATANAFETTVAVTDPTADRTITLPDATGTVVLADGSGNVTVSGDLTVSGTTTTINSTTINATTGMVFEGATANDFETTLTVTDPTADRTLTLPDATGTLATQAYVDTAASNATFDASSAAGVGLDWNATTDQFDIDDELFTTKLYVDTLATGHTSSSTTVHGIADTTALATKTYADSAVSTHNSDTTDVHGIADAANLATKDYANTAVSTHSSDSTDVHGIADTSLLTTTAGSQTLTNKTLTSPKINEDVVLLASSTELNILDGATLSTTELNYLDGVTSAIQTQLNNKQPVVANVSDVEIGYLDGVTSAIQTQLDNKSTDSKTETLTNKTLTSPVINTPTGITKTDVGLANVDNTSDANKPVSTAQQTALDLKANLSGATFTGAVSGTSLTLSGDLTVNGTTTTLNSTSISVDDKNIELGSVASPSDVTADGGGITLKGATDKTFNWVDATDSWTSSEHINLASGKDLKVNGTAVISSTAGGFIFTDGTQTLEGTPSRTVIIQKTESYTLSSLTERDDLIEMGSASALTLTIPTDATLDYPIGTSIDILQTGAGQVTIAPVSGTVTVNATPGLKLRTTWSSATLFKRAANTWVVFGDLTA